MWWQRQRGTGRLRRAVTGGVALTLLLPLVEGAPPARAEAFHWGEAAVRLTMSAFGGIPTALEAPGSTSWSVSTIESYAVVWHRTAEATVGTSLRVSGSLTTSRKENTLGALGTATLSLTAPPSITHPSGFTALVTGEFRRTQALFQVELLGTATDGTGEVVPLRVTGSGPWRPTSGDGVLSRITGAEADMQLTMIFPGNVPPPPGPKATSAILFEGTAQLPAFPCPPPVPGQQSCIGTFSGMADSVFVGDNAAGIWALNLAGPFNTTFTYADLIQPGVPCVEGQARGAFAVEADSDAVLGVWTNRVDIPQLIKGAELAFDYTWTRVGAAAVLSIANVSLWIHVPGPKGWFQVIEPDSSVAPAVAAFMPAITQAHVQACQDGVSGPPITAEVRGVSSMEGI